MLMTSVGTQTSGELETLGNSEDDPNENRKKTRVQKIVLLVFSLVFIITVTVAIPLIVLNQESLTASFLCPDKWVRYLGECFFFSDKTASWEESQRFCVSKGATLAVFDSPYTLNFLQSHSSFSQYWIGLRREPGCMWRWVDGTLPPSWLKLTRLGIYAYLHRTGVDPAIILHPKKWICSKSLWAPPRSKPIATGGGCSLHPLQPCSPCEKYILH
ncbi:C-type lectin domain family 2 member D-like isoform X1 [Dipodomys spectabilis]|uniref:C-type lectin domain family 2 member D-like isoform X1 n=1 Tax=Dipodomys spectabilis TaxID=105255 RepID=UPI001C53907A|nr:C-type lectin domain family 2 member D-like isoform X1 [Dipodomys spectabilis]